MGRALSVCIVGAGSSYTPELIEGLLARPPEEIPVARVSLHDVDSERLGAMAGFGARAIAHAGRDIELRSGTELAAMLAGADFVISQIRVGGMAARRLDESIPLRYGIIGQETTGPGGMAKALRTIPHMIEVGRTVARVCPEAFILNYTNPSGIIAEAVSRHTEARIIGLCSGMPGIQRRLKERFGDRYPDLKAYAVGLNHFGFIHRMESQGRDVTAEIIRLLEEEEGAHQQGHHRLYSLLGAVPISYVNYFFHHGEQLAKMRAKGETRADEVARIEREILAEAALPETVTKPKALARRGGGGYAAITFAVMRAIAQDTGEELVCNVPNRGAVEGIEDDAVVEVMCRVDRAGAHPLPVGLIPLAFRGLAQALKAYETLTVEAAVRRSRRLATLALMNHPLVGDLNIIEPLLDELLSAHGLRYE